MAKPIVALRKWRFFRSGFDEPEAMIRKFEQGNFEESEALWILPGKNDENVKAGEKDHEDGANSWTLS